MRKFIAYLSLLIATVLGIAVSVKPLLSSVNSELDFKGGQTFTYQLTNADENIADQTGAYEDEKKVYEVAEEMESRLVNYGVSQYDIKIDGNDTIRVSLYESNSDKYSHIASYLRFDGKLALATSDNEFIFANYDLDGQTQENMFGRDSYITFNGYYPAVVLPVNDVEKMQEAIDHALTFNTQGDSSSENNSTSEAAYLYMWNNWDENCVYTNKNSYSVIGEKLVLQYDAANIWYEQDEDSHASIVVYFNVASDENATSLNMSEVKTANENAKYLNAVINASVYEDVTVNLINSETLDPVAGAATTQTTTITPVFNFAVIGFVAGFLVSLFAAFVFARVLGITFAINTIAGFMITSAICVALGTPYSVATVAALSVYAAISMIMALIYLIKAKRNFEKLDNLQKACIDTNKSVIMINVDVSVVMVIIGIFTYALAGSYYSSMGVVFIIGGLVNLLINLVLNRLSLNCLAQSKFGSNKYHLYGIIDAEKEEVEEKDVLKEAKEETLPAQKVSKVPHKLLAACAYGLAVLAGVITISIMSGISTPYNEASLVNDNQTRLVVYANKDETLFKKADDLKAVIDTVTLGTEGDSFYEKDSATSIETFERSFYTHSDNLDDSIEKTFVYYLVYIDTTYDISDCTIQVNGATQESKDLSVVLEQIITDRDPASVVSVKESKTYGLTSSFYIGNVALASFIGIIASVIYLLIRYRTTLALAICCTVSTVTAFALTAFSFFRMAVYSYITIPTISVALLGLVMAAIILEGNKLKVKLAKGEVLNFDQKVDQYEISYDETKPIIGLATAISILFSVLFCIGANEAVSELFLFQAICFFLVNLITVTFMLPLYKFFMKLFAKFSKIGSKGPKSNKKKLRNKHKEHQRGKEVEEATFIGIND